MRWEHRSRRRCRGRSRAGLSAGSARPIEPWPSSSKPSQRSKRAAPQRYRLEAERELRKLGRNVYRRSARGTADDGLSSLTARELELARLVVDRKTNPQIAAELFLSQKTVETHLRNIFRKVGVANRVELARAVERSDRQQG